MNVNMSPGTVGVHLSLSSLGSMVSKRTGSKDTYEITTRDGVEQVSMSFPIYEDTKLLIDKDIKLKWQDINDTFSGTFEENLEYRRVYVTIHKSGLYRSSCKYPTFPCTNVIHWIVLHTDPETMVLSSASGTQLATFMAKDFQDMYHLPQPVIMMEKPFSRPNNNENSRDILKS